MIADRIEALLADKSLLTAVLSTPGMDNTAECGANYRVTCVPGRLRGKRDSELGP